MSRLEEMKAGRITILKEYLGDGCIDYYILNERKLFTAYSFSISLLLLFSSSLYIHTCSSDLHTHALNN